MTNIINFNKKDLTKLLKTYKKNDKKKFIEMIKNPNNDFNEILNKFKNKKNLEKNCNEVCLFNKIEESYNKYFFEKNRNKILNNYFSIVKKNKDGNSIYLDNDFDANYGSINYINTNSKSKNSNIKGGRYCNYEFDVVDMEGDDLDVETMRNELGIKTIEKSIILIMKIYTKLIDRLQFHNCESDDILQLFDFYGQIRKFNNDFYAKNTIFIKSSDSERILQVDLETEYNNNNIPNCIESKLQECINIINGQVDEIDEQYVNNVDDFLNRINQENYEYTFQDLYITRHYLKRLIQDQFTKFLNNYAVINDNYLQVRRGNFSYINFLMNIKNRLSNYLENFDYTDVRQNFLEDYQELIDLLDEQDQDNLEKEIINKVFIIMKGGNVTKLFMNNFVLDGNTFSLNEINQDEPNREHRNYLQNLSDFDFDIKIDRNLNNPFREVKNEEQLFNRMQEQGNKDFLIKELISRKFAFKLIRNFFEESPMNMSDDIKNNIQCHIQYFYSLLCHLQINLTKDFYDLHISHNPQTERTLAQNIHQFTYFTSIQRFYVEKNRITDNNDYPRHMDKFFSLTSYYNLGTIYRNQNGYFFLNSFDLTRLMLRLKIDINVHTQGKHFIFPVMSKAEVFDFGYSHSNSLLSFALPIVDPKDFRLKIKSPNPHPNEYYIHDIKIKDYKFILFELLHISIYTTDQKTQKRYERFLKILNNIKNVPNLESVFTDPCYSLIVKYQNFPRIFNLLDGIIILRFKIYNEYSMKDQQFLTKLNGIEAWREINEQFDNNNNKTLYYRYYGQKYYSENMISTIFNLL
jgi:hypothetical protein